MPPAADRIDRSDSRAVLIGVSTYRDPSFPSVPAAGNSLRGMHRILVNKELGGWPDNQVVPIFDPVDCRRVMSDLRRHAQNTSGVLLLYFVGHGTITENGDLVLAVSDTIADEPDVTGLEYSKIRSVLRGSPAKVKAVVLDCCYSGRAIDVLAGDGQVLADSTDIRGTYTLTAADRTAHAGQADACTAFTGELLDLISTGIAGGPPVLTFAELYPHLRRRLSASNLPAPNQRGTDTADKCPVTKNAFGNPNLLVKGDALDDEALSADEIKKRAILESREVLLANLADAFKAKQSQAAMLFQALSEQSAEGTPASAEAADTTATTASGSKSQTSTLQAATTKWPGAATAIAGLPTQPRPQKLAPGQTGPPSRPGAPGPKGPNRQTQTPEARKTRRGINRRTMILGTLAAGVVGAAAGATVRFWPVSDKFTDQAASAVAFSPNGRTLAAANYPSRSRLWDVATGDTIAVLSDQDDMSSLVFSPNGKTLATGGFYDVRLRDARTGVTTVKLNTPQTASLVFSPDGKTLATGGEGGVRLWDVATGRTITTLTRQGRSMKSVALSPNGKMLAGSDTDDDAKALGCWLWDVATGRTTVTFIKEATYSVVFSPDGKSLATGGEGGVRLWDVATGRSSHTVTDHVSDSVAFSPDGKVLARGTRFHGVDGPDGGIWLWKLQ